MKAQPKSSNGRMSDAVGVGARGLHNTTHVVCQKAGQRPVGCFLEASPSLSILSHAGSNPAALTMVEWRNGIDAIGNRIRTEMRFVQINPQNTGSTPVSTNLFNMNTTKPCIIRWTSGYSHYTAYNQDGREILHRRTYVEAANAVEHYGYTVLPPASKWHQGLLGQIQNRRGLALG